MGFRHYPEIFVVEVGTPLVLDMRNREAPMTITARPGEGGTMSVEFSTSLNAIDADDDLPAAAWQAWAGGTVSGITSDTLLGPVSALRITAITEDGHAEVVR